MSANLWNKVPGRLILTTVGLSTVNRDKLERLYFWGAWQDLRRSLPKSGDLRHRNWIIQEPPSGVTKFSNAYAESLSSLDMEDEKKKPKQGGINVFSAEATSLYVMTPTTEDKIILLTSDSAEGVVCGLLNQRFWSERSLLRPEIQIIPGLQQDNVKDFYTVVAKDLFKLVADNIHAHEQKTPVFNITGGFKSVIPICTYIALIHDMQLFFTFEDQPEAVAIDPTKWPEAVKSTRLPLTNYLAEHPEELMGNPITEP